MPPSFWVQAGLFFKAFMTFVRPFSTQCSLSGKAEGRKWVRKLGPWDSACGQGGAGCLPQWVPAGRKCVHPGQTELKERSSCFDSSYMNSSYLCYFDTCVLCVYITTTIELLIVKVLLIRSARIWYWNWFFANVKDSPVEGDGGALLDEGLPGCGRGACFLLLRCWCAGFPWSLLQPCAWLSGEFCRQLIRLPVTSRALRWGGGVASWKLPCKSL